MSVADAIRHGANGAVRLRARWVLPIHLPPIENGEVVIEDGRIVSVGKATTLPAHDLGMSALMPGLVNVHAHLEYTVVRGLLEDMPFFPWIRMLTALKAHLTLDEWVASATLGAAEMLASGITTVADASDAGASLTALLASGQRAIVYREVFGIEREPDSAHIVGLLNDKITGMRAQVQRMGGGERVRIGISPHAPYTVRPDLFRALAEYAVREQVSQAIHLSESPAEVELIAQGTGPFAEMFTRRGIAWAAPGVSPTRYLDDCGALTPTTLVVHAVHVSEEDAALLKARGCGIAHCPKSNGKLAAGVAPIRTLLDAGLPVGLGTDSPASNNGADLFEEMRLAVFQARNRAHDVRALTARDVLHMATLGGAQAIGMAAEVGSLERGKRADLCAVRLDGLHIAPAADDNPAAALAYGARASDVALTMVDGRVVYEGGRFVMLDVPRVRQTVTTARAKLRREAARAVGTATA